MQISSPPPDPPVQTHSIPAEKQDQIFRSNKKTQTQNYTFNL